jgi:DNA polymerase-4
MSTDWPRVIVHADMDAFYAAVEQLDDPRLRGRPLLVGSDSARGVVLTASYEARSSGAGSAMPMQKARRLCPDALIVPPRFERYQEVSARVMEALAGFSPLVEPLSLDEAFLDMTGSTRLFGAPAAIGARIKAAVRECTGGLTASVGISATRFVAKVASGFRKPDGLTIVPPLTMRDWLAPLPVACLWGAGPKTAERLRALGYETIGDVARADPAALERSLGALGERFSALARGLDPREVVGSRRAQSVGSEHTLNVDISARAQIEAHLRLSADSVAARLRRSKRLAHGVRVKLKTADFRVISRQTVLAEPTDVAAVMLAQAKTLLDDIAESGPFRLVGLTAYDLRPAGTVDAQLDLLPEAGNRERRLETAIDALVDRFGRGVVQRAGDLRRDRGVGVAANLDFLREREGDD